MSALRWPARLILVRHGESVGNVADQRAIRAGAARLELDARDADVVLSATGERQAAALGAWLAGLDVADRPTVIRSSPYARAVQTAELIAEAIGLETPAVADERLRERDLGMFDGLTGMGIRDLFPEEAERRARTGKFYYRPPGGESWADVVLRVRNVLRDVREELADEQVLIVSHQAVIMNFRYALEPLSEAELMEIDAGPPVANCSMTSYRRADDGGLRLVSYNDVRPLDRMDEPVTEEDDRDVEV